MDITRRAFLRHLGITLSGLVLAGCGRQGGDPGAARERVRQAWLDLDKLALRTRGGANQGKDLMAQLVAGHRASLDDLVAAGELRHAVADDVHTAYVSATRYVYESNRLQPTPTATLFVCYQPTGLPPTSDIPTLPPPPTNTPLPTNTPTPTPVPTPLPADLELVRQTETLINISARSALDTETLARFQGIFERDIAQLVAPGHARIPSSAVEAARFLVGLLGQSK